MRYNVRDYGATGNGTTDDTIFIQAAVMAAVVAGGGDVYLPAGVYRLAANVNLAGDDITVTGDGRLTRVAGDPGVTSFKSNGSAEARRSRPVIKGLAFVSGLRGYHAEYTDDAAVIDCDFENLTGLAVLFGDTSTFCKGHRLRAKNCAETFVIKGSDALHRPVGCSFEDISVRDGDQGIVIEQANNSRVDGTVTIIGESAPIAHTGILNWHTTGTTLAGSIRISNVTETGIEHNEAAYFSDSSNPVIEQAGVAYWVGACHHFTVGDMTLLNSDAGLRLTETAAVWNEHFSVGRVSAYGITNEAGIELAASRRGVIEGGSIDVAAYGVRCLTRETLGVTHVNFGVLHLSNITGNGISNEGGSVEDVTYAMPIVHDVGGHGFYVSGRRVLLVSPNIRSCGSDTDHHGVFVEAGSRNNILGGIVHESGGYNLKYGTASSNNAALDVVRPTAGGSGDTSNAGAGNTIT